MNQWKDYIDPMVKWESDSTLTILWFGINDITRATKTTDDNVRLFSFNDIMALHSNLYIYSPLLLQLSMSILQW